MAGPFFMRKVLFSSLIFFTLIGLFYKKYSGKISEKKLEEPPKIQNKKKNPTLKPRKENSKKILKNSPQKKAPPKKEKTSSGPFPIEDQRAQNYTLHDSQGNLYIESVTLYEDDVVVMGDVLIGSRDDLKKWERSGELPKISPPNLWDNGVVPFQISDEISPEKEKIFLNITEEIERKTPVQFKPKENEKDYVLIKKISEHCYSHLGKIEGQQEIGLSKNCSKREISHEILHTLGLIHEHSREDRDQYLKVLWENIEEKYHPQFYKLPSTFLDYTQFDFDQNSLMLYDSRAFSLYPDSQSLIKRDGTMLRKNERISSGDFEKIRVLYE